MKLRIADTIFQIIGLCVLGYVVWTSPHWFGPWIREVLDTVWPLGFLCGAILLFAAHVTKKDNGFEESYKFARWSAWCLLASFIILRFGTDHFHR
jgi:hypothetical protein